MDTIELNESISIYIEWKSSRIKSAFTRYKLYLDKLKESSGVKFLEELDEIHIARFQKEMESQEYAESTIAFAVRVIRNFLEYWQPKGHVKISVKNIKPQSFLTPEQPVVDLEDFEQMSDILDERYLNELQRKLAIHLLWDTGMRVSEMTDLEIGNIKQTTNGMLTAKIRTKKTDRYNLVIWSKETEELLTKYLGWRVCQEHPTDLLFVRMDKKSEGGLTTRTIERWVKQLAKDAMIGKPITPHSFRHGKAHHILDNGGTVIDVQTILRHKNLNSSLNYMRLNESRYMERASRFVNTTKQSIQKQISEYELARASNMVYTSS